MLPTHLQLMRHPITCTDEWCKYMSIYSARLVEERKKGEGEENYSDFRLFWVGHLKTIFINKIIILL